MDDFRGLEILYSSARGTFRSKVDCLVAALHMIMINRGNKCVGTGDSWPVEASAPSELLPEGWNSNQEVYTLRYVNSRSGARYLVKCVKAGSSFLINVLNATEEKAAGMSVNIDNHVAEDYAAADFAAAYSNLENLSKKFENEILEKVGPCQPSAPGCSAQQQQGRGGGGQYEDRDPLILGEEERRNPSYFSQPQRVRFPSVGRGDLDPLGRGGSGMLFDPSSMGIPAGPGRPNFGIGGPGGLPPSAVPPGARFDPFGPPTPGRGPSFPPNPDHLPPPGFEDAFL